jgi:hypothetical protein
VADQRERALQRASELALEFLAGLGARHVGALADDRSLVAQVGGGHSGQYRAGTQVPQAADSLEEVCPGVV